MDPFGGVALGALHAMQHGLHWVGVELEEKFVGLGCANIEKWAADFGPHFQGWGSARLIQGDSRELAQVVGEAVLCVSSPPYATSMERAGGIDPSKSGYVGGPHSQMNRSDTRYGATDGQLAALPEGNLDACISSPPYTASLASDDPDKRGGLFRDPKRRGDKTLTAEYGESAGQLGAMVEGGFDAAISSPPYADSENHNDRPVKHTDEYADKYASFVKGRAGQSHGRSPGQLAAMPEGALADGVVSSPPFEGSIGQARGGGCLNPDNADRYNSRTVGMGRWKRTQDDYGSSDGQLGQESGATFWEASRLIVEQVYQVLKPGGVAIWVTKSFVRKGERVDFPGQWRQLCEAVGFETLHEHRAHLVEERGAQYTLDGELEQRQVKRMSFFRRLHAQKYPHLSIDWETVLCMRKPGAVRPARPAGVDGVGY